MAERVRYLGPAEGRDVAIRLRVALAGTGQVICGARAKGSRGPVVCTRAKGHAGQHVEHAMIWGNVARARWGRV